MKLKLAGSSLRSARVDSRFAVGETYLLFAPTRAELFVSASIEKVLSDGGIKVRLNADDEERGDAMLLTAFDANERLLRPSQVRTALRALGIATASEEPMGASLNYSDVVVFPSPASRRWRACATFLKGKAFPASGIQRLVPDYYIIGKTVSVARSTKGTKWRVKLLSAAGVSFCAGTRTGTVTVPESHMLKISRADYGDVSSLFGVNL